MKNFFENKDNILDKVMTVHIRDHSFAKRESVKAKINEIISFYALFFTQNSMEKAQKQLENKQYEMRRKDALLISFFCGSIAIILLMVFILLSIPDVSLNL